MIVQNYEIFLKNAFVKIKEDRLYLVIGFQ